MAKVQKRIVDVKVVSNVGKEMNKGTAAAGGLSGALKGVASSANLATGGIRAMTMALISSGVGALVVAVGALTAGIGGLIGKSREFSKEMSNLKAISGATEEEFEALKDNAIALGSTTAFTATQVAQLSTEFAKLGFTTGQIIAASEATLDLAAATGTDLATAASVTATTLKGFGLAASETDRVVNVMAASFSSSALDMNSFQESMKLVAPIAASVKMPIEQATAALGLLADAGFKGSLGGTALRKIMSDLVTTTGKDFPEALQITREKLDAASSDAEKLAIAKEMVGDRAKSALLALVPMTDQLLETQKALTGTDAAARQADIQLDNLDGSLTKLSSAWDGFMLSLESGDGILSKISRFFVDLATSGVELLKEGLMDLSEGMIRLEQGGRLVVTFFKSLPNVLERAYLSMKEFGLETRLALEDVPFWGNAQDKAKLEAQLEAVRAQQDAALKDAKQYADEYEQINLDAEKRIFDMRYGGAIEANEDANEVMTTSNQEFREGESSADDEAAKQALENRKEFLKKLDALEKKQKAKTEEEKIQMRREAHLAELAELGIQGEEKRKLEQRINKIYDDQEVVLRQNQQDKIDKIINDMAVEQHNTELERKLAANQLAEEETLAELDRLKATEEEKNAIKQMYSDQRKAMVQDEKDKEKELEHDVNMAKLQMASQALDAIGSLANAFAGESEAAARKNFKIQKALSLASATISGVEGTINAYKTAQASPITTLMPAYPTIRAAIAGTFAAGKIAAIAKQKFKGGGGRGSSNLGGDSAGAGGGAQAPSFNVIGQTSAGDNMIANTIGEANSQPMRAYVVEGDISSQQELGRKANAMASVG